MMPTGALGDRARTGKLANKSRCLFPKKFSPTLRPARA
jgi:hypothetical protein